MSLTWTAPVWMWPLLLVLAAGAVIWTVFVYGRTRPAPRPQLARLLVSLRVAALLLLVLALAGPVLSRILRQADPGRLVMVFEDSASMNLTSGGATETGPSRWQAALTFAARVDSSLAELGWPGKAVYLRGNGLDPVQEFQLNDPVIPDPAAHGTDLNRLLGQVADQTVGAPVRATVLLSDGQETRRSPGRSSGPFRGGEPDAAGQLLVVGVGDPVGAADRLIRDLRYPDTAYAGDEIVIELAVTHRFVAGDHSGPAKLTLTEAGKVVREETVQLQGGTTPLELTLTPEEEGLRVYELEISSLVNERFLANNKVSLAINVRRGRSRILVLAQQPGWDVRFLAQAALSEPRIELAVVHPTAGGLVFADSLVAWRQPTSATEWDRWDGVVLFGWQGLTGSLDWEVLDQAVNEGLGLLVMPPPSSPRVRDVTAVPAGLAAMLPIQASRFRWVEGDFFTMVPAAAAGHPVLHLVSAGAAAGSDPREDLSGLPPLRRVLGVTARPESLVLLEAQQVPAGATGAILPLLVADPRGQGRAVWFGGQRLWELAFYEPSVGQATEGVPHPARRLVQNLLVWLAAGQEESGLVFAGRRGFYQEGERIQLSAQWRDMRGQPVLDRSLAVNLRPIQPEGRSGQEQTFALSRKGGPTAPAEVLLPPLPPGTYAIQLVGQGEPPVLGAEEFLVVTAHSVEETQVRQDQRRLQLLASRGQGSYHQLAGADDLKEVLAQLTRLDWTASATEKRDRLDFWAGWPFLVLAVGLLAVEWYLRRRNGML